MSLIHYRLQPSTNCGLDLWVTATCTVIHAYGYMPSVKLIFHTTVQVTVKLESQNLSALDDPDAPWRGYDFWFQRFKIVRTATEFRCWRQLFGVVYVVFVRSKLLRGHQRCCLSPSRHPCHMFGPTGLGSWPVVIPVHGGFGRHCCKVQLDITRVRWW